jgi:hypothetical protein
LHCQIINAVESVNMPWLSIDPHYAIAGFLVGVLVGVTE